MKIREWSLSTAGVVILATALTLIVLAESIFPPWAPYFIVYAVLVIYIPLALKACQFGSFGEVMRSQWKITLGIFVIAVAWDMGVTTWLYEAILKNLGLDGNPYYSLSAAVDVVAKTAAVKFGISTDAALLLYAAFIVLWAPVGEELFYRGYMQGTLRQTHGFWTSALVSAAFFAIRHATHFFFLWPNVPVVAAASWVAGTFVFGLLMSWLYEKTRSLWPAMLVHAAVNVVELLFM
jgi:membrane protease YdiL (CAAX protease family)